MTCVTCLYAMRMPSSVIPVHYARLTFLLSARGPSGVRAVTTAFNYVETLGSPDYESNDFYIQALDRMQGDWSDGLAPMLDTTTSIVGGSISTHLGGATRYFPAPVSGGFSNGALAPPQEAIVLQLYSETPGRKGRGRIFLPDAHEADFTDAGVINAGTRTTLVAAALAYAATFDDIITGSDFEKALNGVHILHTDGSTPSRVMNVDVATQPGWLRRRGR